MWINLADCEADDLFAFPLHLSDHAELRLEVWVGYNARCELDEQRNAEDSQCWLVWSGTPTNDFTIAVVRSQDIIGRHLRSEATSGPNSGTLDDCYRAPYSGLTLAAALPWTLRRRRGSA